MANSFLDLTKIKHNPDPLQQDENILEQIATFTREFHWPEKLALATYSLGYLGDGERFCLIIPKNTPVKLRKAVCLLSNLSPQGKYDLVLRLLGDWELRQVEDAPSTLIK